MAARGKDLTTEQKKLILKLKSEGNSGGKIGSITLLGINRFTVCHFLKRNEKFKIRKMQISWLKVHESQNMIEKDKAVKGLTEDLWILWKWTAETHYQIFLLCIMKIHRRSCQNVLFKEDCMKKDITEEQLKKTTTISKQNRLKRRLFCRSHLHWSRVLFSDETQIVSGKNKKVFVWRKNDRSGNNAVLEFTVLMTQKLHS